MKAYIGLIALVVLSLLFGCVSGGTGAEAPAKAGPEPAPKAVESPEPAMQKQQVKEFEVESFTKIIDGKYYPQFSPNAITVNKGDLVRIKITVTSGKHDFKIDEFGVYADTPTNMTTVVEFVADKSGEFVYYCNKPGHRELGHWGTLTVLG